MIIHDVEQNTDEWMKCRLGLPTASSFSKIVTSNGELSKQYEEYASALAADMFAGKPVDAWAGNYATERGHELEPEAAAYYEAVTDFDTESVGFITDDEKKWGCSPDRLVGEDGLLEIKCLMAKGHIETLMYINKNGKIPTKYVQQTQGQMLITGRKWCDVMFYHPDLPPKIFRVHPIEVVRKGLINAREKVIARRDEILEFLMKENLSLE